MLTGFIQNSKFDDEHMQSSETLVNIGSLSTYGHLSKDYFLMDVAGVRKVVVAFFGLKYYEKSLEMVFFANFLPATPFPNGAANRKCQELGSTAAEAATTATKVGEGFQCFWMVFKDF